MLMDSFRVFWTRQLESSGSFASHFLKTLNDEVEADKFKDDTAFATSTFGDDDSWEKC